MVTPLPSVTVSGLRLVGWRNLLTEMFGREADAVADEFLRDAVRASSKWRAWKSSMRDDAQRIQDILATAEAILDHVFGMTEAEFADDPKTIDAAFFSVIVLERR